VPLAAITQTSVQSRAVCPQLRSADLIVFAISSTPHMLCILPKLLQMGRF
jgi:hypothetical protein